MSGVISSDHPSDADRLITAQLEQTLRDFEYFETEVELRQRIYVLSKLNEIVQDWIKTVCKDRGLSPEIINTVAGGLYTFGSYRLGVHSKGTISSIFIEDMLLSFLS